MHVCLFTPTFLPALGGAERDADIIVRGLMARGHRVTVLARQRGEAPPPLPYPVVRYRRPPMQHLCTAALARPLIRLHRRDPYDVVLAFYGYPNGYAANLARRRTGAAVVASPRGGDLLPHYHDLRKWRVPRLIAKGYRGADRIVTISGWLGDRLKQVAGEPLPPVDLVYNGVDLAEHDRISEEAKRTPPNLPLTGPFVLHLARIVPVKEHALAMAAVHRAADMFRQRGLTYAVVGDGKSLQATQQLVHELGIGDIVRFLGSRRGTEKAWLLDNALFMVASSREEGLGNVTLEAMASGLPMLGSDIGPHQELIGNHGWGMLFRSGDPDDMAAKMRAMLDADREMMRRAALRRRELFSIESMLDGYEQACLKAIESRRSAAPAR